MERSLNKKVATFMFEKKHSCSSVGSWVVGVIWDRDQCRCVCVCARVVCMGRCVHIGCVCEVCGGRVVCVECTVRGICVGYLHV